MELFIKVVDGQVIDHPVTKINLMYAFGNEIPLEYIPFNRVFEPVPGHYEIVSGPEYVLDSENNVVNEVWSVTPMTEQQKQEKIDDFKARWLTNTGWNSWTFDEETFKFIPPIVCPVPTEAELKQGIGYNWVESRGAWIRHKLNEAGEFAPIE